MGRSRTTPHVLASTPQRRFSMIHHSVPMTPEPRQAQGCLNLRAILQDTHDPQTFLSSYWLEKPWFSEASRERRLELAMAALESTDLGFLLSRCANFSAAIPGSTGAKEPNPKAARRHTRLRPPPRGLSIESALEVYEHAGATIYAHIAAHPASIPVPSLAFPRESLGNCGLPRLLESTRQLAQDLGVPVVLASLFAVRGSRGSGPHFDPNENFTIQLRGSKRWRVWNERSVADPMHNWRLAPGQPPTPWTSSDGSLPDGDTSDFILTPGAALYVPRGFMHEVTPEEPEVDNLALNFCIRPQPWLMVLTEVLRVAAEQEPQLRKGIFAAVDGTPSDDAFANSCRTQLRRLSDILQTLEPEHVSSFLLNTFEYAK